MKEHKLQRSTLALIIALASIVVIGVVGYIVYMFIGADEVEDPVVEGVYEGPVIGIGEGELYPKRDFTTEEAYAGTFNEPSNFLGGVLLAVGGDESGPEGGQYLYTLDITSRDASVSLGYMGADSDRWSVMRGQHVSPSGEWVTFIGEPRAQATSTSGEESGAYVYRASFDVGVHTEESIADAINSAVALPQQNTIMPQSPVVNDRGHVAYAYAQTEPEESQSYGVYIIEDSGDVHVVTEAGGTPEWVSDTRLAYLSEAGLSVYDTETKEHTVIVPREESLTLFDLDSSIAISPDARWLAIGNAYQGPVQLYRITDWSTPASTHVALYDTNGQQMFFSPHSDFLMTVIPEDEDTPEYEGIIQFFPVTDELERLREDGDGLSAVPTITTPAYSIAPDELLPVVLDGITTWTY